MLHNSYKDKNKDSNEKATKTKVRQNQLPASSTLKDARTETKPKTKKE